MLEQDPRVESSLRGGTTACPDLSGKQSHLLILRWRLLQQMKDLLRNDGFFDGIHLPNRHADL
ncbi:hypothetical protein EV200_103634 [Pedobacter psychrotolerans]|uniref:Uncharacterized protein n=1 Tax=Pedobacter psychrotolerans TaxID=1843235 RepID=A0A4R2HFI1_9SPHI|nr:hypothetical protein EV200_103634 [Pedobacter psychrotolerans]